MTIAAPIADHLHRRTGITGGALATIWETRDRAGRLVVLTSERLGHILSEHEEMASRLEEVRRVVEHPDFVTRDRNYRHRENHYRSTQLRTPLVKVVVQYRPAPPQGNWQGEVITAYPVKARDPREEILTP